MAKDEEIITILQQLAAAYPGLKVERGMIEAYVEHLRDMPGWLLKRAAKKQVENSQWFPKVAELRQTAANLAGTSDFASLDQLTKDPLFRERLRLERVFYQEGRLEAGAWESLRLRFEQAGRPHQAERTGEKLQGRVELLAARLSQTAQRLEERFFNEGRLVKEEWEQAAREFERLDRPHQAEGTREKLRRLEAVREDWRRRGVEKAGTTR